MKVGIIRCRQTEDYCPGTTDFSLVLPPEFIVLDGNWVYRYNKCEYYNIRNTNAMTRHRLSK